MTNGPDIRRYTRSQLREMAGNGEDRTDWERVMAKTEAELEADIASDPDAEGSPPEAAGKGVYVIPERFADAFLRLDPAVLDFFRVQGPGFKDRIHDVLRAHVEAARRPDAA